MPTINEDFIELCKLVRENSPGSHCNDQLAAVLQLMHMKRREDDRAQYVMSMTPETSEALGNIRKRFDSMPKEVKEAWAKQMSPQGK